MKMLKTPFPGVSAKVLIEMMFDLVHTRMRPDVAAATLEKIPRRPAKGDESTTAPDETAVMDEAVESVEKTLGLGYSVQI